MKGYWTVTATSTYDDYKFVASIEHKTYPFFGIQFQPERVVFEWSTDEHSSEAIFANRAFYDSFVRQARFSEQTFNDTDKEFDSLIYNSQPVYTLQELRTYMQVYFDPYISGGTANLINPSLLLLLFLILICQILY